MSNRHNQVTLSKNVLPFVPERISVVILESCLSDLQLLYVCGTKYNQDIFLLTTTGYTYLYISK